MIDAETLIPRVDRRSANTPSGPGTRAAARWA